MPTGSAAWLVFARACHLHLFPSEFGLKVCFYDTLGCNKNTFFHEFVFSVFFQKETDFGRKTQNNRHRDLKQVYFSVP